MQNEYSPELFKQLAHLVYDVRRDDARFRHGYTGAESFDLMRKRYPERREWSSLEVSGCSDPRLAALGFTLR